MRILVATISHDAKMYALPRVVEAIYKMIDNTPHEVDYYICASDKRTIEFCEDNDIRYESISFNREAFDKHIRTIDVPYGGYDEFYLYKTTYARNVCFLLAVREAYDYIFFVDADNLLECDGLNLLLSENKKDISGWYFLKNFPSTSVSLEIPKGDPFKVAFTTAGCRLLHKDVFMNATYKFIKMSSDDRIIGNETIRLGYGIWIHPAVYSDHIGSDYTYEARNYRDAHT